MTKKAGPVLSCGCALCGAPAEFKEGGWTILPPFKKAKGSVCLACVRMLTCAWAKEFKRKNLPYFSPDPTNPPAGAGTARVEILEAVA